MDFTSFENSKINDLIKNSISNKKYEMELRFLNPYKEPLTYKDFINAISVLKGIGLKGINMGNTTLDISFHSEKNIRFSINGEYNIVNYCNNNSFSKVKEKISFMNKKRISIGGTEVKPLDLRNYDIRLNMKEENILTSKTGLVQKLIKTGASLDKSYRYKKRYSFESRDGLFRFDLSLVKSSSHEDIIEPKKKLTKKELRNNQKRLVLKPSNQSNFDEWWNGLTEDSVVSLREDKRIRYLYFKNLEDSETLKNDISYEIEMEFIGSYDNVKGKNLSEKVKSVRNSMITNMTIIMQSLQQSKFIISNSDKKKIKKEVSKLTNLYRFTDSMPLSVTLEPNIIMEMELSDYYNTVNIRKNYSVTEKADGERNLLYIDGNGDSYLINRQSEIKKTGCKFIDYKNCLLDGEFVVKDKKGDNIKLYLVFDIYFSNGIDFRERIFIRTEEDMEDGDNFKEKSRLEELEDMINGNQSGINLKKEDGCEFCLELKVFKFGNLGNFSQSVQDDLDKKVSIYKTTGEGLEDIKGLKQDTKIFSATKDLLKQIENNTYIYETDGLIFTPTNLKVGEGEKKKNKYGGRWNRVFKWKPSSENSIDFKLVFMRDMEDRIVEKINIVGDTVQKYIKGILMVGYDKNKHNKINGIKVVNDLLEFDDGYNIIPFEPHNPYIHKIYEVSILYDKNGRLTCKNGDIIKDNSIVEFSYDLKSNPKFCWIPLRVRDSLMPNAYSTSLNVWNTIFNPITTEQITTGEHMEDSKLEYYSETKFKKSEMRSVFKFHNYIKKLLIQKFSNSDSTLLDLACGEGGDLYKWMSADLSFVLGLDIVYNNISNERKGACSRIIQARKENPDNKLLENIIIVWADSIKNIKTGMAGNDALNRFYLDMLYDNTISSKFIDKVNTKRFKELKGKCVDGFNIVSCQFAFHYFFKSKEILHSVLINISENLKIGGKFIATMFDGRKIFKMLKGKDSVEVKDPKERLLWSIKKKYDVENLTNDAKCLGLPIDVYVETFSKEFTEYLVNIDYLSLILEEYGLEIIDIKNFEDIHKHMPDEELKEPLTPLGEKFSYLNMCLIITKVREVQLGGSKSSVLDKYVTDEILKDEDNMFLQDNQDNIDNPFNIEDQENSEGEAIESEGEVEVEVEVEEGVEYGEQKVVEVDFVDPGEEQELNNENLTLTTTNIEEIDINNTESNETNESNESNETKENINELQLEELDLKNLSGGGLVEELNEVKDNGKINQESNENILDLSENIDLNEDLDLNNILKNEEIKNDSTEMDFSNISDLNLDDFNINNESNNSLDNLSETSSLSSSSNNLNSLREIDMEIDGNILNFDKEVMNDIDLNIDEEDLGDNNSNHNIKVVKINADKNTIKMINK